MPRDVLPAPSQPKPTRPALKPSRAWTPDDDLALARGYADGDPFAVIIDSVGRDAAAVKARWAELNPDRLRPADLGPLLARLEARAEGVAA